MRKTLFAFMVFVTAFAATSCQKDGEDMSPNDINQEPVNGTITRGEDTRKGDIKVGWVQLWENGPKFAEYNVGAEEEGSFGGYYKWSSDCVSEQWGDNWRMPTQEEFEKLISSCTVTKKNVDIWKNVIIFTGKGVYQNNSVSFPDAGGFNSKSGEYFAQGQYGYYWSSTFCGVSHIANLYIELDVPYIQTDNSRELGFSVRAVLNE